MQWRPHNNNHGNKCSAPEPQTISSMHVWVVTGINNIDLALDGFMHVNSSRKLLRMHCVWLTRICGFSLQVEAPGRAGG
jgi:hypothetical protein